jgi:putative PIG3 family NAD(P)H quinone oxidoreductase
MKAIVTYQDEPQPWLVWEEVADVTAGPGEVLVAIRATAVNRADLSQAQGNYPPPPGVTEVLGLEMAGEIAALGAGVTEWAVGDRVCALLPGGGYAEQVVVPAGMLIRLPDDWSFAMGAAIPEVWLTAFLNLFIEGRLQAGERALIHAGGSGVGTAAIQLVRAAEATAYATAGAEFKLAQCRELGAALAVNYKKMDWLPAIMAATGGEGVDVILDPVGADYLPRDLRALRENGRLVHIGLLSGSQAELNLGLVMGKSLRLIGSRLRPRPVAEKIAITRQFQERFWPLLEDGTLSPIIDCQFPIMEAGAAHEYVRQNKNLGKVILTVD